MKRFDPESVRKQVELIAAAAGVPHRDSLRFADALVDADLNGTDTHGVTRVNIYIRRLMAGLIDPVAKVSVESSRRSVMTIDAGNGLGQVQAWKILERMIPVARRSGVVAASVRNSTHIGALSYICNHAAQQNMILFASTNSAPSMSPLGGSQPFFGTNPLAVSFPTGKGYPLKVDLATSVTARGNIIAAAKKRAAIPFGWALDADGNPTDDPLQALAGTVLPMAGHKGYALALMVEVFSGVLSGAAIGAAVGNLYNGMNSKQDVGHFFTLLDIEAFMEVPQFIQRIDGLIDGVKNMKKANGAVEILVPGERSYRNVCENLKHGIPIDEATLEELETLSAELRVPFILTQRNEAAEMLCAA